MMNETRVVRLVAILDEARTEAADLLDELPSTSEYVMKLRRVQKHANQDIKALQEGGDVA
jgi:HD-like signal output (HDOD) protein